MTSMLARAAGLTEERRSLKVAQSHPEIRGGDDGARRFLGHGAVFDSRTPIGNPLTWGWYEEIAPGAFTKTLSEGDARMLIDHNSYYVVSRVSAGTLSLAQDKIGLAVDSALDERLSYVTDLITNLDNKNITGMSIGFWVVKADWSEETVETSDGQQATVEVRRIKEIKLAETSPVTFPAFEDTDAGLRSVIIPALRQRADVSAIERRARYRPELLELLPEFCEPDEMSRVVRRLGFEPKPLERVNPSAAVANGYADEIERAVASVLAGEQSATAESAEPTVRDFRELYADLRHLVTDLRSAQTAPEESQTAPVDEPDDTTRSEDTPDGSDDTEPAASTRSHQPSPADRMRALSKRYHLPAA